MVRRQISWMFRVGTGSTTRTATTDSGIGQRRRQQTHPPVEEPLDSPRSETVTDLLKSGRVRAGGEAVGQRGPLDPHLRGLAFGPLVPVEPNLDRVREVRADLDERGTEVDVPQVEVETRHR